MPRRPQHSAGSLQIYSIKSGDIHRITHTWRRPPPCFLRRKDANIVFYKNKQKYGYNRNISRLILNLLAIIFNFD
jgi:hypothetical protein